MFIFKYSAISGHEKLFLTTSDRYLIVIYCKRGTGRIEKWELFSWAELIENKKIRFNFWKKKSINEINSL